MNNEVDKRVGLLHEYEIVNFDTVTWIQNNKWNDLDY